MWHLGTARRGGEEYLCRRLAHAFVPMKHSQPSDIHCGGSDVLSWDLTCDLQLWKHKTLPPELKKMFCSCKKIAGSAVLLPTRGKCIPTHTGERTAVHTWWLRTELDPAGRNPSPPSPCLCRSADGSWRGQQALPEWPYPPSPSLAITSTLAQEQSHRWQMSRQWIKIQQQNLSSAGKDWATCSLEEYIQSCAGISGGTLKIWP